MIFPVNPSQLKGEVVLFVIVAVPGVGVPEALTVINSMFPGEAMSSRIIKSLVYTPG
jgi:hypothetical protein